MSEMELESGGELEGGEPTEVSEGPSTEERAAMSGWKEGGELSAEDFLAKRDDHLGLARKNNERLEQEIFETRKTMDQMAKMQRAFMERERRAGYDAAMADIKAKKAEAIGNADAEGFAEAEKEEQELKEEQTRAQQDEHTQAQKAQVSQMASKVMEQYPEAFETKQRANAWAEEVQFQHRVKGLPIDQAMTKAVSAVAEQFGFKQKPVASLEGGGSGGEGNKDFASLPPEAKNAYKKFAEAGLFEGEKGKKEYAAEYWSQA